VDTIEVEEFDTIRKEMMSILKSEETNMLNGTPSVDRTLLSEVMEQAWITGTFWFSLTLSSPTGLSLLFYRRIQSFLTEHATDEIGEVMPFYWEKWEDSCWASLLIRRMIVSFSRLLAFLVKQKLMI